MIMGPPSTKNIFYKGCSLIKGSFISKFGNSTSFVINWISKRTSSLNWKKMFSSEGGSIIISTIAYISEHILFEIKQS